ncbi:HD domain-containing protein [Staphylococcus auricularis]|uniref:HD domain-containing protein n=1 Tax=Staphylococcus auricularis TaxID=29379 RepID=UPI002DB66DB8|nr:HD domain-containing protein [Staphylococcus auricularis]MEB6569794.1 HD domain-containing protein [Staphylococcus auricularis]
MQLQNIRDYMIQKLSTDQTGHDLTHIQRVEKIAVKLAEAEQVDDEEQEIILAAVYLHDTIDDKVVADVDSALEEVKALLKEAGASNENQQQIMDIILNMSYAKNIEQPKALKHLGQIVQDADRIDASGVIGIARAFYYGGTKGHPLYDETTPRSLDELNEDNYRDSVSVVNHFHEKLLHLEGTMNTNMGKHIAAERTETMRTFLKTLNEEINGER